MTSSLGPAGSPSSRAACRHSSAAMPGAGALYRRWPATAKRPSPWAVPMTISAVFRLTPVSARMVEPWDTMTRLAPECLLADEGTHLLDLLGGVSGAAVEVAERRPRLGRAKGQAGRFETAAPGTGQDAVDGNPPRAERLAETPCVPPALVGEIALRAAVLEAHPGGIPTPGVVMAWRTRITCPPLRRSAQSCSLASARPDSARIVGRRTAVIDPVTAFLRGSPASLGSATITRPPPGVPEGGAAHETAASGCGPLSSRRASGERAPTIRATAAPRRSEGCPPWRCLPPTGSSPGAARRTRRRARTPARAHLRERQAAEGPARRPPLDVGTGPAQVPIAITTCRSGRRPSAPAQPRADPA